MNADFLSVKIIFLEKLASHAPSYTDMLQDYNLFVQMKHTGMDFAKLDLYLMEK